MKTLLQKDLRENYKLALTGLAIFTLLLGLAFRASLDAAHGIALGQNYGTGDRLQPLLSGELLGEATFFCAIFGTLLGWLQIRNEAHRDLWAFLIHRPATRSALFWGKAAAGLGLYFLAAGLPLLGTVLIAGWPGRVAAPFEWSMARPVTAVFLTGVAYYFAGLLIGLRQARWFGSRTFGLGAAIVASLSVNAMPEFWQALAITLALAAILAAAAWGAYQSGGFYRGQPVPGRLALTASLTFGSFIVLALLVILVQTLFSPREHYHWKSYRMTAKGQVWIVQSQDGEETITDLDGKPVLDPETGRKVESKQQLNGHSRWAWAYSLPVDAGFVRPALWRDSYNNEGRYFTLWNVSEKNLWYVDRLGKLTAFNGLTRRHVGDLIPHNASGEDHFFRSDNRNNYFFNPYNPPGILSTPTTVYHVDLEGRKLEPLFTPAGEGHIAGYGELNSLSNCVVLTRNMIRIIDFNGKIQGSLPYQPAPFAYPQVEVANVGTTNRLSVWFHPDPALNLRLDWKLPERLVWLSPDGGVAGTLNLPPLHELDRQSNIERIMDCLVPPALQWKVSLADLRLKLPPWRCVIPSVLSALVGAFFLRRYHFTRGAAAGWLLFLLLLGIPALLTFVCVQEWPKRESCPRCKKLRAVDRESCEHCQAPFAPPETNGTEIFAPLAKAQSV